MTRILHRQIHHKLPVAAAAFGIHITDTQGRDYIDASEPESFSGMPERRVKRHPI